MPKYRKLPVMIEAWQFDLTPAPEWVLDACSNGGIQPGPQPRGALFIKTLEGTMTADLGDWIIQGVNGEIYPCKPDVFAKTYEPVQFVGIDPATGPDKMVKVKGERLPDGGLRIDSIEEIERAVDTTDITETALHPALSACKFCGARVAHPCSDTLNCELPRDIHIPGVGQQPGAASSGLPDDWFEEHDGQRLVLIPEKVRQHIAELEAQLQAEGEHTAAANANIDRLNTEIERITRRQQGDLMGKD